MKKLISMVMAAAMVVSLVPATAFAANTATFKVVNDKEYTDAEANKETIIDGPQVQLKLKDVDTTKGVADDFEITLDFNNAELKAGKNAGTSVGSVTGKSATVTLKETADKGEDSVKIKVQEVSTGTPTKVEDLEDDDIIVIDLKELGLVLTKTSKNTKATVEVGGDFGDSDALTFATVLETGIKATLKKVAEVAEEETTKLEKDLTIKSVVGDFHANQEFELKVSSGFEFNLVSDQKGTGYTIARNDDGDEDKVIVTLTSAFNGGDEVTINKNDIEIEAVDAKVGDVAKITVKSLKVDGVANSFKATADAVEAAKVVDDIVTLEVDEDEDVPVIYSGVNVNNDGITDDSDHESLEITLKEAAKGALDVKKSFTLTLPDGVYATDVDVTGTDGVKLTDNKIDVDTAFANAYKKGEEKNFEFARKTFVATDDSANTDKKEMELKFTMTLVAEPGFTGDVKLTLGGDAFDKEQEVTIAKFVSPYTVEAQANDLIIDYRNTKVPSNIVVKEAEEGLWSAKSNKELKFAFDIDRFDDDAFENDATYTVDSKSDMEVKANSKGLGFKVTDESSDGPATVTISDISLYMSRNIAAGAYDLELLTNAGEKMMTQQRLFTTDEGSVGSAEVLKHDNGDGVALKGASATVPYYAADYRDWKNSTANGSVNGFDTEAFTVKEGFVNVITAGRDQDDASFTKKVVVPVGEKYLIAGEEQVALDVPAYISAAGYTMLPVRAVATALGINNNNVLWNQASRTVTILYGQRIITMVAGQKVVTVNGNTIPASATVQIKDGRTFLPMRDLATALGVTDITWDAATKTATMNGSK